MIDLPGWKRSAAAIATTVIAVTLLLSVAQRVFARENSTAPARQATSGHTINVSGHGEVTVAPDQATLTLGVDTKGNDAASALSDNSSRVNAVISAVEAQGVPANHIQTTNLSVSYDSEHNVYLVSHQVTLRLDDVTRVGAVLDAAVNAGANNSWGVSFGMKDPSAAHNAALQAAVKDARSRADTLASALQVSISGVASVSESSYSTRPPEPLAVQPGAVSASAATQVQPGELTVSADIQVSYTFGS